MRPGPLDVLQGRRTLDSNPVYIIPLGVVVGVDPIMSLLILPRLDFFPSASAPGQHVPCRRCSIQ
jgi:hypothetical protein